MVKDVDFRALLECLGRVSLNQSDKKSLEH